MRDDLARQRGYGVNRARSRAREAKIERVDPERLHQMQDFNFFWNGRISYRRRLQPIAQTLVIDQNRPGRLQSRRVILVPVVNEIGSVHGKRLLAVGSWLLDLGCWLEARRNRLKPEAKS